MIGGIGGQEPKVATEFTFRVWEECLPNVQKMGFISSKTHTSKTSMCLERETKAESKASSAKT